MFPWAAPMWHAPLYKTLIGSPLMCAKPMLVPVLAKAGSGLRLNEHLAHDDGELVFLHACKLGLEGVVSKRLRSGYRSGLSRDWLKGRNLRRPP
jgi:bifunctional non-homologous end joining protein LigD